MFDLGLIHINRLIVHEIPRHFMRADSPGSEPVLSEVESRLSGDAALVLRGKSRRARTI